MSLETVRLLPLEGAPSPLSVHLVLADEGSPGPSPFVTISQKDDLSRVYLVAIKGDEQTVVEFGALKILPNAPPELLSRGDPRLTNPELEKRWETERGRLVRFRSAGAFFPRLLVLDEPAGPTQHRLPPLFYSRPGRCLFAPPCPKCLAWLTTCHDDAVLLAASVPLYSASLDRYLYCPACAAEPSTLVLYGPPPQGGGGSGVKSIETLVGEIAEGLAGRWSDRWISAFPCRESRDIARSQGAAALRERWVAWNVYDTPYLLTGLSPLDLYELGGLLGGRPVETFLSGVSRSASGDGSSSPLRHAWVGMPIGEGHRRLLFAHDPSGLDAVEIFLLKIAAFRQIVQALLHYYRLAGRPHLDLHPRHLLFDLAGAGDGLPVLWSFQVRLHGLGAVKAALPGGGEAVIPAPEAVVPFAAPEVLEFQLAGSRPAELTVVETEPADDGVRLICTLSDPYGLFPDPDEHDVVVVWLGGADLGFDTLLGRVPAPASGSGGRGRTFVSEPVAISGSALQRLTRSLGVRLPGARYRVYPDFGMPSDLYSLGLVLLSLLLGNDSQDVQTIARGVTRLLPPTGTRSSRDDLTPARLLARTPDLLGAFARSNVFFAEIDRAEARPNAIPEPLWQGAIELGLRLVSRLPGYSYAATHGDFDPTYPAAKLETVLQDVTSLETELKTALFGRQHLHLELQQVISELAGDESLVAVSASRSPR